MSSYDHFAKGWGPKRGNHLHRARNQLGTREGNRLQGAGNQRGNHLQGAGDQRGESLEENILH